MSVQLHAPPSPSECETGQSDSVVDSYMSKIASECASLCCCTRPVKKNIRSGQASLGMEMGAVQSGQGSLQLMHSSDGKWVLPTTEKHAAIPCVFSKTTAQCVADGQMAVRHEFRNAMHQALPAISNRSCDLATTYEGITGNSVSSGDFFDP